MELDTRYNHKQTEDEIYKVWQDGNFFYADESSKKPPYTIVIPPPNITGILHMGHALNNTIQDILIRYKRMQGFESLWIPGTDHAGIATQNVVERKLQTEGLQRRDIGREKFVQRVWQWKEQYGDTIIMQLKKLGSSCDWSRLRFTMDEGLSEAVTEVFVKLYRENLIYRGVYVINWCPRCQTALSDEEVTHRDVEGTLYYIKYPLKKSTVGSLQSAVKTRKLKRDELSVMDYIVVATTRPETMLGDTAVAVNNTDKRYKDLIGRHVILPLVDREICIIKDSYVDPKFGSGAVKVTPAHDLNDYMMALRNNLDYCLVMNPDATMNQMAGGYQGMDRFKARQVILEDLKQRKLLEKTQNHPMSIGHCYRCHTVVEPYLSPQWFVKMKVLAKDAIREVKTTKRIKFYPSRWTKVYLNWMENIRDWCISRQIWWGHRLPVYYCKKCQNLADNLSNKKLPLTGAVKPGESGHQAISKKGIIVSKVKPQNCPDCGCHELIQDEDVLDTWFSSWLWPFSTLGWPKDTNDIKRFYPTDALVTASEILFFWVSRMIMAGLYCKNEIPFKNVYIHGTVRDDTGKKMSKSLGNIIDPLEIIEEFGADALRLSIISITATGQDVYLSKEKFHIGRNFANKIWNASRFVLLNIDSNITGAELDPAELTLPDKWILSRLNYVTGAVTKNIDNFKFNEAVNTVYEFFWHDFCDWYVELAKSVLVTTQEATTQSKRKRQITLATLCKVLDESLRLLHPFMPFLTEKIWQSLKKVYKIDNTDALIIAKWPHAQKNLRDIRSEEKMSHIIAVATAVRNFRQEVSMLPKIKLDVVISSDKLEILQTIEETSPFLKQLLNLGQIKTDACAVRPKNSAAAILDNMNIYICLEGIIDIDKEREKLHGQISKIQQDQKRIGNLLSNKEFIKKAPEAVIINEKTRLATLDINFEKIQELIKSFE